MIKQPVKGSRNVNDLFYEEESRQIEKLNREFFQNVELTDTENKVMVWLCGLEDWTINVIVEVFRKVREEVELLLKGQASSDMKESLMESNLFDPEVIDNIVAVFESVVADYVFRKKRQ